jgi:signal peptidase II
MSRIHGTRLFVLVAAAVVVLDQLSKWAVKLVIPAGTAWPAPDTLVGRYVSFTHVGNTGVAFGLFQGQSDLFIVLAIVVVAVLLWYRSQHGAGDRLLDVAIGLQVGGALGNLMDRVRFGHVTDFIDFKVWPVFNVADMAIVSGVLLLAWRMWHEERAASTAETASAEG